MLANSEDPDQTPHDVASDLGLRCFSMTLFLVYNGLVGIFVLFMPFLTEGTTGLITCVVPLATKLFKIGIISYKKENNRKVIGFLLFYFILLYTKDVGKRTIDLDTPNISCVM